LEEAMPLPGEEPDSFGRRALAACRAIREGRAAGFAGLGGAAGRAAATALALASLERARDAGRSLDEPLADGLAWGAFCLWAGRDREAQEALERFLSKEGISSPAYLALGDSLWRQGRAHPSLVAYREGYLADPGGGGWPAECPLVVTARQRLTDDPEWGPEWWAVGAYAEGIFPPFGRATAEEARRRWERFQALRELRLAGEAVDARLFASGLLLSENTEAVLSGGRMDLLLIRRTLQEVNPAAWARHRETLGSARR
jgi:hypothetical protein